MAATMMKMCRAVAGMVNLVLLGVKACAYRKEWRQDAGFKVVGVGLGVSGHGCLPLGGVRRVLRLLLIFDELSSA